MKDNKLTCKVINNMIQDLNLGNDTNYISDGSHTYGELYHHRAVLFASLISIVTKAHLLTSYNKNDTQEPIYCWKSKLHDDGTMFDGYFIVGIKTWGGMATYHYDMKYWDMFDCQEIERAPEFDGHTPDMAIERIGKMFLRDDYIPYEEDNEEDKEEYIDIYLSVKGNESLDDCICHYSTKEEDKQYIVCFDNLDLCIDFAQLRGNPYLIYSSSIPKSKILDINTVESELVITKMMTTPTGEIIVDYNNDIEWREKFVGYIRVFIAVEEGMKTPTELEETHENIYFNGFTSLHGCISNAKIDILRDSISDEHHTFTIYYADVTNLNNVESINGNNIMDSITVNGEGLTWKKLDACYNIAIKFYEQGSSLSITWKYDGGEYTT